ncbi:hypothetical protein NZD88_12545 [Chryseobacterium antibioticum]|uniref:TonB C-terminal domain-containing protein n=1 Tax=Chryseobacterium pyrolae TaxID=2987481 RepID=A0ABT2II90_9FLAO|nr:hypothetical protein [Chryseobacterium pyrolae]MCT2408372.1 hypothetical protein [Chryseobacterium pyrolae]
MMKIRILFLLLAIFSSQIIYAQMTVLEDYPKDQYFYEGGAVDFYKEMHEYLINNKLKECGEKEIYQPRIIITKEAGVKLVKDNDTANIAKNKCAYNLSKEVIKNLKHWNPAEVKGNKMGAVTEFVFYPKDLMSNYKQGYNADAFIQSAQYPDGLKKFKSDFHDNFMSLFADYHINGEINLEIYVSGEGHITNPRIYPEVDNKNFNISFLRTLSRLKKTWKPAFYSNIPIKQKLVFPMKFSVEFGER